MMAGASRLPWSAQPPAGLRAITACLGAVHPGGKECLCAGSCRHPYVISIVVVGQALTASAATPELNDVRSVMRCQRRLRRGVTSLSSVGAHADDAQYGRYVACSVCVLPAQHCRSKTEQLHALPGRAARVCCQQRHKPQHKPPKRATMCTAQRRGVIMQS
jgi:hypothetical protein